MRLFIAINFTDDIKSNICDIIGQLRELSLSGNFTRRDNLHITLAFLGDVDAGQVPVIRDIMDSTDSTLFTLELSGFGGFGPPRDALYWYGVNVSSELASLRQRLYSELKNVGFYLDGKPFKPHITLARRCKTVPGFSKKDFANSLPSLSMDVTGFSLMCSERINGRLTYTEIFKKDLG